ncbi:hypothetical protein P170DRAFT_421390 [Aspergillus steynii IBT 23096]|uniref:Helicase C-terminal domain-containing protein n=1 Tax=Aspergillus steynii IBT 23096 TaxID=1392250 RepID=A0A2I2GPD2_9EURO|nr:uncharacterized protein P170DRAFT_421390 [Aspergillus steynii IBT 23096]PLB54735.1 hypothetical protein P170DRAFT_421390 [Aspergillus steynii IBT 23096]
METPNNLSLLLQAVGRLHRLGQRSEQQAWLLYQDHTINRWQEFNLASKAVGQIVASMRYQEDAGPEAEEIQGRVSVLLMRLLGQRRSRMGDGDIMKLGLSEETEQGRPTRPNRRKRRRVEVGTGDGEEPDDKSSEDNSKDDCEENIQSLPQTHAQDFTKRDIAIHLDELFSPTESGNSIRNGFSDDTRLKMEFNMIGQPACCASDRNPHSCFDYQLKRPDHDHDAALSLETRRYQASRDKYRTGT